MYSYLDKSAYYGSKKKKVPSYLFGGPTLTGVRSNALRAEHIEHSSNSEKRQNRGGSTDLLSCPHSFESIRPDATVFVLCHNPLVLTIAHSSPVAQLLNAEIHSLQPRTESNLPHSITPIRFIAAYNISQYYCNSEKEDGGTTKCYEGARPGRSFGQRQSCA